MQCCKSLKAIHQSFCLESGVDRFSNSQQLSLQSDEVDDESRISVWIALAQLVQPHGVSFWTLT